MEVQMHSKDVCSQPKSKESDMPIFRRNRSKSCSDKDPVRQNKKKEQTEPSLLGRSRSRPNLMQLRSDEEEESREAVNIEKKTLAPLPTSTRSTRSQNPEFVAKQKMFLQKITGGHSADKQQTDKTGDESKQKKNDENVSYSVKVAAKRAREKSMEPDDLCTKNDNHGDDDNTNEPKTKMPKSRNSADGNKCKSDIYCWVCHREGVAVSCHTCPRSFHLRCAQMDTVPDTAWMCPECATVMHAENVDTRSRAMQQLSLERFCSLLKYALNRLKSLSGTEPFWRPVDENEFPHYRDFVTYPMDFSQLEYNIRRKAYGSTEAFIADVKWILHDCIVFNTQHTKLSTTAKYILKVCKWEMVEIETCPDCYYHAHTRKDSWFIEACHRPHILVWAKLKGFPFWPGKVMRINNELVDVRFFGAHDRAWVPVQNCFLYSKESPVPVRTKKQDLQTCIKELEDHVKKLRERFGRFQFPPNRTPFCPEKNQLLLFLPNYKERTSRQMRSRSRTRQIAGERGRQKERNSRAENESPNTTEESCTDTSVHRPNKRKRSKSPIIEREPFSENESNNSGVENKIGSASLTEWSKFEKVAAQMKLTPGDTDDVSNQTGEKPSKRRKVEKSEDESHKPVAKSDIVNILEKKLMSLESVELDLANGDISNREAGGRETCVEYKNNDMLSNESKSQESDKNLKVDENENPTSDDNSNIDLDLKNKPNMDKKPQSVHEFDNALESKECKSNTVQENEENSKVVKTDTGELSSSDMDMLSSDTGLVCDKNVTASSDTAEVVNDTKTSPPSFGDNVDKLPPGEICMNLSPSLSSESGNVALESTIKNVEQYSSSTESGTQPKEELTEIGFQQNIETTGDKSETTVLPVDKKTVINDNSENVNNSGNSVCEEVSHTTLVSDSCDKVPLASCEESSLVKGEALADKDIQNAADTNTRAVAELCKNLSDEEIGNVETKTTEPENNAESTNTSGKISHVPDSSLSNTSSLSDTDTQVKCFQDQQNEIPVTVSIPETLKVPEHGYSKRSMDEVTITVDNGKTISQIDLDKKAGEEKVSIIPSNDEVTIEIDIDKNKRNESNMPSELPSQPSGAPPAEIGKSSIGNNILSLKQTCIIDKNSGGTSTTEVLINKDKEEVQDVSTHNVIQMNTPTSDCSSINVQSKVRGDNNNDRLKDTASVEENIFALKEDINSTNSRRDSLLCKTVCQRNINDKSVEDEVTNSSSKCEDMSNSLSFESKALSKGENATLLKSSNSDVQKASKIFNDNCSDLKTSIIDVDKVKANVGLSEEISLSVVTSKRREASKTVDETIVPLEMVCVHGSDEEQLDGDTDTESVNVLSPSKLQSTTEPLTKQYEELTEKSNQHKKFENKKLAELSEKLKENKGSVRESSSSNFSHESFHSNTYKVLQSTSNQQSKPALDYGRIGPRGNVKKVVSKTRRESSAGLSEPGRDNTTITQLNGTRFPGMRKPHFSLVPSEAGPHTAELNRHADKIAHSLRSSLEEMLQEYSNADNCKATVKVLQLEIEKLKWKHKQELAELKHNADLITVEIRRNLLAEHQRIMAEAARQWEVDKQRAIEDTKKKQWCACCGKEAIFYCCWNTAYCDYPCQQKHWPQHMDSCCHKDANKAREEQAVNDTVQYSPTSSRAVVPIHSQPTLDSVSNNSYWMLPEVDVKMNSEISETSNSGNLSDGSNSSSTPVTYVIPKGRKQRCGQCKGCKSEKCGQCAPCKNTKTHQVCKQRRCSNLQPDRATALMESVNQQSMQQRPTHLMVPSVPSLPSVSKQTGVRYSQYAVLPRTTVQVVGSKPQQTSGIVSASGATGNMRYIATPKVPESAADRSNNTEMKSVKLTSCGGTDHTSSVSLPLYVNNSSHDAQPETSETQLSPVVKKT